jgi:hypothetical protein
MKIYRAIVDIANELSITGIEKSRRNTQQGYSFRGIDDVYAHLSRLLSKYGVCILPRVTNRDVVERQSAKGMSLFYVTLRVEFDFVYSEDGSKHTVVIYGEAMDSGDKATNKAMSAAYKYACLMTFCIPTEGDNDADATSHEVKSNNEEFYNKELELIESIDTPEGLKSHLLERKKDIQAMIGLDGYMKLMGVAKAKVQKMREVKE